MSEQSFMERFGPRLVANGYPILPIMHGTKKPGRWRSGAWSDYPDWTRHADSTLVTRVPAPPASAIAAANRPTPP